MTYSKKQEITENNEKHSNWSAGRCSGPLLDIFGSTQLWTHAVLRRFKPKKLNLNILVLKIEICAQNIAFMRKKSTHITQNIGAQATHRRSNYMAKVALGGTNNVPKAKKIDQTNVA